ncbi:unannotated protein [freshwater metagenome]|uniref:Unannotated protein n=1 Tax=freshwater metagenome TaxID=449393 RepID=A0A6J6PHV1_9ZZZZ
MADQRRVLGGPRTARDRVTIYEVAERAGVSIATVSHALNRPEKVNPATRSRVLDAVDELGFTPKASAVSLARKGVGRIGVLAAFGGYPTYLQRLVGVMEACREKNIDVVPFDGGVDAEGIEPWLSTLPATGRLDGLLIMGDGLDEASAARLVQRRLPTVLVDHLHPDFSCVTVDDEHGGYLLGRHLIDQGYVEAGREADLVFAGPTPSTAVLTSPGAKRVSGLVRALAESDIDASAVTLLVTEDDFDGGVAAAQDILTMPRLPRLVVGNHDAVAAGVHLGLSRRGVRVPEQVAVAGYDGVDIGRAIELTTVSQPFAETGRLGAQLLLELMSDPDRARQEIQLSPTLVVGRTA